MPIVKSPRRRKTKRHYLPVIPSSNGDPADTMAQSPPNVQMIPITLIERDGRNHRLEDPATTDKIKDLARSLQEHGQQTPVQVYEYPAELKASVEHPYLLAFGFRRLAAAEINGWPAVAAVVKPMPLTPDGAIDRLVIERNRGIENLQRLDLNPMEECLLVEQLVANLPATLDSTGTPSRMEDGRLTEEGATYLARSIGRTEAWVRDRLYLSRLSPDVKRMVTEGRLFLIYAREIAKLADFDEQERVASFSAADPKDGHCGTTIHQVRRFVAERQNSLRSVPWHLDKEFPKNALIVGACAGCVSNSSNDKQLFEHDAEPSPEGYCLRQSCFEAKRTATDKAVTAAVAKLVKQKVNPTEKAAEEVAAPFVKPGRVARQARKHTEGQQPAKPKERVNAWDTPEYRARTALNEAERKWREETNRSMTANLKQHPGRLTAILLLGKTRRIGWGMGEKDITKVRDLLKLAAKATPQSIALLEKRVLSQKQFGLDDALNFNGKELLISELAGLCGVEIPAFPKLEDFLPLESETGEKAFHDTPQAPEDA